MGADKGYDAQDFIQACLKMKVSPHVAQNTRSEESHQIIKRRGHFPSDEAATELLWLSLRNIAGRWGSSTHDWKDAMNQFAIPYEERFTHPYR